MKPSLPLRSANLLYLLSMLLVITAGSALQSIHLSGGLIATEVLFILLPTLLWLRRNQIPLKQGLRLNPIGPWIALLSLLLGFSIHLFSILIEALIAQLTAMQTVPVSAGSMPSGLLDSGLYFLALAVFAPLCEEILFRGAIQAAYEERRTLRFAITLTAFMFAFYHFRLSGLPALLPVAFILGYVAWRANSLYASMLVHAGLNAAGAANTLVAIHVQGTGLFPVSPGLALLGVLMTAALLFGIQRLQPAPAGNPTSASQSRPTRPPGKTWLSAYWPLGMAGLLYLAVTGLTLATSFSPASRASGDIHYFKPYIETAVRSRYQITNKAGQVVGDLDCLLAPHSTNFSLDCVRNVQAFEVQLTSSYFKEVANRATWSATWDAQTLALLDYSFERQNDDGFRYSARLEDGQLVTDMQEGNQAVGLVPNFLLEYEWPWRADVLDTNAGDVWKIPFGYLLHWDESQKKSIPAFVTEYLQVYDDETLEVPAGSFTVRKFTLAGQSAWYARDDHGFPRPVQWDDGMVTYALLP